VLLTCLVFQGGEKYLASTVSRLKSRITPSSLMKTAMSSVLNFLFERQCCMSLNEIKNYFL
jgi:hypothetical protein